MRRDVVELVRAREMVALAALESALGQTSLCALSRSGRSYPAAKYHEGAVSALAQVRRELRRRSAGGAEVGESALLDAARGVRNHWRDGTSGMAEPGPDWQAYVAGGVEALDAVVDELDD